jgi:hypothetical protein
MAGVNMHNSVSRFTQPARSRVAAASVLAASALVGIGTANADDAQARALFKTMSDYLAAQKQISFDADTNLEVVTTQKQKIAFASSGKVTLIRPDKLHITRAGGFSNTEMFFDGKTVTISSKGPKQYAQVEAAGTIEDMVDLIRDKYDKPAPAADLLTSDMYARLMPQVKDVDDLGSGVIRGTECDHFAFRMAEVDVQIWIAHGARPYPCRYVITSTKVEGSPQYTIDVSNWKTGSEVAADSFSFTAPADFRQVKPGELNNADELPDSFAPSKSAGATHE